MTYPTEDCWIVKILTDSYAGNFEREMTAYATGCLGECGVGDDLVKIFNEEVEEYLFEDIILNVPDDHGCHRPCSLDESDNTSVLIFFCEKPKPRHLKLIQERAAIYANNSLGRYPDEEPIKIIAFELVELAVDYRETSFPWES